MLLTDTAVRQAKPKKKLHHLYDGCGLSLQVSAHGHKRWEFRFQWHGRTSKLALGTYPEIKLKGSRELREETLALAVRGLDPRVHRKVMMHGDSEMGASFNAVFTRWMHIRPSG